MALFITFIFIREAVGPGAVSADLLGEFEGIVNDAGIPYGSCVKSIYRQVCDTSPALPDSVPVLETCPG